MLNIVINKPKIQEKYPRPQECPGQNILYRITYSYRCKRLTGSETYPITNLNFNEEIIKVNKRINPGDLVEYTPNPRDINYGGIAKVTRTTNKGSEMSEKGKKLSYDLEFINPKVGTDNKIIKKKLEVKQHNADGSIQIKKANTDIESFICAESFINYKTINDYYKARRDKQNKSKYDKASKNLWSNFVKDENDNPKYPDISKIVDTSKEALNNEVNKMVKVGFLLGKKENRPKIKVGSGGFTLSFLMPVNSKPGYYISVPINLGNNQINIVIRIPLQLDGGNVPTPNDYLNDIPILREFNSDVYHLLKPTGADKDVNLQFIPTFVKGSEYIYESSDESKIKDLNAKMKPSSKQIYYISSVKIVPQNGNNFKFKELGLFNKDSPTLVFDLQVILELNLKLALPDKEGETGVGKFGNRIKEFIMNGSDNCPNYMDKVKSAFSGIPSFKKAEKNPDSEETDYSDVKKLLAKPGLKSRIEARRKGKTGTLKSRIEARRKGKTGTLKSRIEARRKGKTGRVIRVGGRRKTRRKKKRRHKKSRKRCN